MARSESSIAANNMLPKLSIILTAVIAACVAVLAASIGLIGTGNPVKQAVDVPDVGRTLMRQAIVEAPDWQHFQLLAYSRRADELLRLRDLPVTPARAVVEYAEQAQAERRWPRRPWRPSPPRTARPEPPPAASAERAGAALRRWPTRPRTSRPRAATPRATPPTATRLRRPWSQASGRARNDRRHCAGEPAVSSAAPQRRPAQARRKPAASDDQVATIEAGGTATAKTGGETQSAQVPWHKIATQPARKDARWPGTPPVPRREHRRPDRRQQTKPSHDNECPVRRGFRGPTLAGWVPPASAVGVAIQSLAVSYAMHAIQHCSVPL